MTEENLTTTTLTVGNKENRGIVKQSNAKRRKAYEVQAKHSSIAKHSIAKRSKANPSNAKHLIAQQSIAKQNKQFTA